MRGLAWTVAAVIGMSAGSVRADFLAVTESAVLFGSLNGTAFSSLVTFSTVIDTSQVTLRTAGVYVSALGTVNFTVSGIGSGTLTGLVFSNQGFGLPNSASVGISAANNDDLLDTVVGSTSVYNLTYAFAATGNALISTETFATSAGNLTIRSDVGPASFTAVPEPSSVLLLGAGLGLAGVTGPLRRARPVRGGRLSCPSRHRR